MYTCMFPVFAALTAWECTDVCTCKDKDACIHVVLKLINYSHGSHPTRASYSGQVDGFRNPMKSFFNLHIDKARKTQYMTINNFI